MNVETRLKLIQEVGEEIVTVPELKQLLESGKKLIAYDGFEPSGNVHIAQGIMRAINVNKMTRAGVKFKMLVADWHAMANNKMGGDLATIQKVGKYLIEVWRVSGMDLSKVEFIWANDLLNTRDYWKTVVQIGRASTVKRIIRCSQIMGRKQDEALSAAQIVYPLMQCTDIFFLKANITQLGMDQRKVNMLAREVGPSLGYWKPVVVSHHMLAGLQEPKTTAKAVEDKVLELKMSKSRPDTAIFMTDTEEDIKRKLKKAYCPPKQTKDNPVIEYCKYLVFEKFKEITIQRDKKHGGDIEITSYNELCNLYRKGELHPLDLKKAVAYYLNETIKPARQHFQKNKKAKQLLEFVEKQEVTR